MICNERKPVQRHAPVRIKIADVSPSPKVFQVSNDGLTVCFNNCPWSVAIILGNFLFISVLKHSRRVFRMGQLEACLTDHIYHQINQRNPIFHGFRKHGPRRKRRVILFSWANRRLKDIGLRASYVTAMCDASGLTVNELL